MLINCTNATSYYINLLCIYPIIKHDNYHNGIKWHLSTLTSTSTGLQEVVTSNYQHRQAPAGVRRAARDAGRGGTDLIMLYSLIYHHTSENLSSCELGVETCLTFD